jgi:N-acetylmuramoyl-L-alanine amidase
VKRTGGLAAVALTATVLLGPALPAAGAIDIDDPNLFGPGEGWPTPAHIDPGDSGPWVVRLQQGLADAGFRPGRIDGRFGGATLGAVYAFQKVNALDRTGVFDMDHWDLLALEIELPPDDAAPDRVEVDLGKQVLFLIKDQQVEAVLPISSGNGDSYYGRGGRAVRAVTPEGSYRFYRHIDGWRISYLGGLYRPYYFRGGYAIHGSYSVPPYPASHGCVRVELEDMDYLTTELSVGMPIYVYGNRLERDELIPTAVEVTAPSEGRAGGEAIEDPSGPSPV